MQLITLLLYIVGLLAALSGIIVFFGSTKANRARSAWYCLAAIFAAIWTISIANLNLCKNDDGGFATMHTDWTFVSAIMLDATFLGFSSWKLKYGKILTIVFLIAGITLSSVIVANPGWLYSGIAFTNNGVGPILTSGPLGIAYATYFGLMIPIISIAFIHQFRHARSKSTRVSNLVAFISYIIASIVILITDFIMLKLQNWSMAWLGPLTVAFVVLIIYYIILRYRVINLSMRWLKFFSYIIVIASIAIVYMIVFSLVFAALFRGSTPSMEVIILNFIMILIFIALMPAMNGLITFIRRLIIEQHPRAQKHSKPTAAPVSHPTALSAAHSSPRSSVATKSKTEHKQEPKHHVKR